MIAAVGMGLAPLLLKILGIESGGILLYGASSTGKTTALNVTASVTGERTLSTFNATANGTEAAAEAHSDLPLLNDEMGSCDPRGLANTIYMLGNEGGKTRMTKTLTARDSKTWRLLVLGTGEIPLIDHLRSAGISTKGGVEARMPSVPADAGRGLGAFDTIHQFATPQQFSDELKHQALLNRGCVLVAFLERLVLVASDAEWIERQRKRHLAITTKLIGSTIDPDGTVGRVARRFALIQLALELAQEWSVTLFPEGQVEWAVESLFADWIEARGGAGSIDIRQAMDRIEALFVAQEFGDRIRHVTGDRKDQIVRNLLATKVGGDFLVPPSVFDAEFAQNVDRKLLIAELQKRGWLQAATGNDTRPTKLRRIPGEDSPRRVFEFRKFWVTDEDFDAEIPVTSSGYTSGYKISDPENLDVPTVSAPEKLVTRPIVCNQTPVTPETPAPHSVQLPCNRVTTISRYGEGIENENKKLFSDSDHIDLDPDDFDWSVAGAAA
jgi:putative DNA primase/helicase